MSQAMTLHWDGTSWAQVPTPDLGSEPFLFGVSDASPGNAWAVGLTERAPKLRTLILHWDDTAWRRVPSPSPGLQSPSGASFGNELTGVDTISKTNAWAVGDYTVKGTTKQAALTVHWNGTRWAWVPNPGETSGGILNGVSMVSATDGWAVGQGSTGALILHWNGTTCRGPNRYSRRRAPCLPQSAPVCLHIQCGRVTYAGVRSLPTNRARHDARAAR